MFIKSIISVILLVFLTAVDAQSQFIKKLFSEIELIGGLGTTHYFGDIGGQDLEIHGIRSIFDNQDIDVYQTRLALVTGLRASTSKKFMFSIQLSPMLLSGSDNRSKYPKEFGRNYEFATSLVELSLQGEYYLTNRMAGIAPYILGGVGAIAYSVNYTENTLDPFPQKTRWYTGNTFIFGMGLRLPAKRKVIHMFDFGWHFSTTDMLDGFKSANNSKDLFFQISYKANIQLYNSWYMDHKGLVR